MPLVIKPASLACRAERLAGTRTCPNRTVVRPPCPAEGVGPAADPGEEMALGVGAKVVRADIFDAPGVDIARRDVALADQFAQPRCGFLVYLVVVGRGNGSHRPAPTACAAISSAMALGLSSAHTATNSRSRRRSNFAVWIGVGSLPGRLNSMNTAWPP